jgi:thioesterase domain-containing protein
MTPASSSQQLITIQRAPGADAKSIFCFPGAGDSITSFLSLAERLASCSIYGIQARGLDGMAAPHASVEQAVLDNIDAVRAANGGAPYLLLGHSFGGWVAFEMARQLAARGAKLDTVVLLDTDPPDVLTSANKHNTRLDVLMELIRNLEDKAAQPLYLSRTQLADAQRDDQVVLLMNAMKQVGLFSRAASVQSIARMLEVFEANLNTRYAPPTPLAGEILLIYPRSPQPLPADETDQGAIPVAGDADVSAFGAWRNCVARATRVDVPGTHMSMLTGASVVAIAEHIRAAWNT